MRLDNMDKCKFVSDLPNKCILCMEGSPYDYCCRLECNQHEFCRGCTYELPTCNNCKHKSLRGGKLFCWVEGIINNTGYICSFWEKKDYTSNTLEDTDTLPTDIEGQFVLDKTMINSESTTLLGNILPEDFITKVKYLETIARDLFTNNDERDLAFWYINKLTEINR